ncbi:MAG TPA: HAD hydrolase-like protein [Streptosporangiaceae bacterium]|jgi:phosphoglycolate phosphatase-like HAD superfamily hydrolase
MCRLLVLWDIDHTLIENHGVNKEIYVYAFELLTGEQPMYPARTDGRTEPEIMRDMLVRQGMAPNRDYVGRMPEALEKATLSKAAVLRERGHELVGARNALIALQTSPVVQSVLSGNIKPNAFTKLSTFQLDTYIDFEVGGYGSDDDVRANLVAFAQERASAKYGVSFGEDNTVLIGDTVRDVQAGRNGGAHVIAVASGSDSPETLRAAGADIVLADLADTQAMVRAVMGFASPGHLQS